MTNEIDRQLLDAASRGDLAAVQEALAQGASLAAKDASAFTALTLAARDGQLHVLLYLLEQGAEVSNDTLMVANMSVHSNLFILKVLQLAQIRQVQPQTARHSAPDAALLQAAYGGDLEGVHAALQQGAQVNAADGQDTAALRWAARGGHTAVVGALLDSGADVNQKSASGWTALMEAVLAGSEETAALLIERGADVNAVTFANASVLYFARDIVQFSPRKEAAQGIIRLLEEHGARFSAPGEDED